MHELRGGVLHAVGRVRQQRRRRGGLPDRQPDPGVERAGLASAAGEEAYENLAETNNFPEFTSRLCPAPCQDACIHGLNERPVAIKSIERAIIDRAFAEGWVRHNTPAERRHTSVGIVGSGPAGLAAADQLNKAGHRVTVYERSDRVGGLLVYGVPNMKLDKGVVARRVALLERAGVRFRTRTAIGVDLSPEDLAADHDAVLVAAGAVRGRTLDLPGADLAGIGLAMPYLEAATRCWLDGRANPLDAAGQDVVVIGGGDTGADCIATALRQGCRSVVNVTRREKPPAKRDARPPLARPAGHVHAGLRPRRGRSHDRRATRAAGASRRSLSPRTVADNRVAGLTVRGADGERTLPAQRVILSIGFTGVEQNGWLDALGLAGRPAHRRRCFARRSPPASRTSSPAATAAAARRWWSTRSPRAAPRRPSSTRG